MEAAAKMSSCEARIVTLHCTSGTPSIEAAELLNDPGFEVHALKPGYDEFVDAGFEESVP